MDLLQHATIRLRRSPEHAAKRILSKSKEYIVVYSHVGTITAKEGSRSEVIILEEDRDKVSNAIVVHNHPVFDSPSLGDYLAAAKWNMKELWVVIPDGQIIVVRRPRKGWPNL